MSQKYSVDTMTAFENTSGSLVSLSDFGIKYPSITRMYFGVYERDVTEIDDKDFWIDLTWLVEAEDHEKAVVLVKSQLSNCLEFPATVTYDSSEVSGVYDEVTKQWVWS